ncbi:hypothetical protein [Halopenitus persicus]|uniref:hypothetical protein n=1 Tax=Halopenitus persicus TaxID=1048396 RepID=UPI0012FDA22A|nr:hypothetical protein [Halopenitus persicus]
MRSRHLRWVGLRRRITQDEQPRWNDAREINDNRCDRIDTGIDRHAAGLTTATTDVVAVNAAR